MWNRLPECGLVFLVLFAGIGSCAPRGNKGGAAGGGTVANKAVVVTGTSNGGWPKSSVGGATIILLAVLSGLISVIGLCCCARWIRRKFCKGAAAAAPQTAQHTGRVRETPQPKTRCHLCLKKVNAADYAAVAGMSGHRARCASRKKTELRSMPSAWSLVLRCPYCQRRLKVWPELADNITFSCDAKNCPVVGTIRGDGNRLSCFICNYDLCEMCANRMIRDDIEEELERGPGRKQEPYYYAAEEELLPSYEDAVGVGDEGSEGPEGRAWIKYG